MMRTTAGHMLADHRTRAGLSQAELARRLCEHDPTLVTLTRNDVSRWETGNRIPAEHWLTLLSKTLDLPPYVPEYIRFVRQLWVVDRQLSTFYRRLQVILHGTTTV